MTGVAVLAPTNDEELASVRSKLKGAWVIVPPAAPQRPARPSTDTVPVATKDASSATPATTASAAGGASNNATTTAASASKASISPSDASTAASRSTSAASTTSSNASTTDDRGARARDGQGRDGVQARAADRAFRDKLEKIYEEEGIAGTVRSGQGDRILTGGSQKVDFDKLPTRPSINLLAAEHKDIVDRLKNGEDVKLEFDVRNWFEKGPIALNNVIAEIPGSEKPDEIVIVGGHLDSWDGATGATDNGTGVATTMEAARLLAQSGVKPKRTIRFMLWGGEEQGLLGSKAWIDKHKDEMPNISAVLVHDGGTNYCAGITATPPMVKPFEEIFAPVKGLDAEMPFTVREVKGLSGGGSDHSSFLSANVPGFFWTQKGKANYNHTHHTQFDTFDAAIPEYQKNSSIVIAVGALGIANLPELLSRENLRAPNGGGGFGGRRLGVVLADDMSVEELTEDGIGAKAGMLVGDKLLKIGDEAVPDRDEMRTVMQAAPAKTKVVVLRKGKEVELPIEFPPDAGPGGALARRWGVRFGDGLTVDVVTPGGLADQAKLQAGDKIVKVGDTAVEAPADLGRAAAESSGDLKLKVLRDGKEVIVTINAPDRP
jgi:hypothetical protein